MRRNWVRLNGRAIWWCWLSVLVASCSNTLGGGPSTPIATLALLGFSPAAVTPTPTPTLAVRTPTLNAAARAVRTLTPPLPLVVAAPDCYETPIGGLWCLGLIHNRLTIPVEQIRVQVYLVALDGTALAMHETPIARSYLLPGERSPYGVHFAEIPPESAGPVAVLSSARAGRDLALDSVSRLMQPPIVVRDVVTEQQESVYRVRGTMINVHSAPLREISVVITLIDDRGRVTGFRQLRWATHTLAENGSLQFSSAVIAQGLWPAQVEISTEGKPF